MDGIAVGFMAKKLAEQRKVPFCNLFLQPLMNMVLFYKVGVT